MSSIEDYKIGMIVYGKITGIKPYGAFVSFDDGITGLIHISEISNGFVKDINNYVLIGNYEFLKIIDIDKDHKQLRLSFKALNSNRKYFKKVKFLGMPDKTLGFSSISDKMPEWLRRNND